MRAKWRRLKSVPGILSLIAAIAVAGCSGSPSPLDPRTTATARIAELGWVMIGIATVVCLVVFGAMLYALRVVPRGGDWQHQGEQDRRQTDSAADRVVVLAGMVLPAAILLFTFGYTVYTLRQVAGVAGAGGASSFASAGDHTNHPALTALAATGAIGPSLAVEIVGHQWWWEVKYPDDRVVTANEVHIPTGTLIRLSVTSQDVIHSFWVPQITGKVDLIPGKVNRLMFRADQPGEYRGMCGEFCGLQHAHMHLRLVVEPLDALASWLDREARDAAPPSSPEAAQGQQIFVARCGECHTVRGVTSGTNGPDLTHLANRRTLGAGIHENTRANLAGWTTDAQAMKPGNKMPTIPMPDSEVAALLAYLEGLE